MCVGHTNPASVQPRYSSPEGGRPVATNPFQAQQMKDQFQHAHRHKHHHHRHGPRNGSGPGNGQGSGPAQSVKDIVSGIMNAIKRVASPSNPADTTTVAAGSPPATARPPATIG